MVDIQFTNPFLLRISSLYVNEPNNLQKDIRYARQLHGVPKSLNARLLPNDYDPMRTSGHQDKLLTYDSQGKILAEYYSFRYYEQFYSYDHKVLSHLLKEKRVRSLFVFAQSTFYAEADMMHNQQELRLHHKIADGFLARVTRHETKMTAPMDKMLIQESYPSYFEFIKAIVNPSASSELLWPLSLSLMAILANKEFAWGLPLAVAFFFPLVLFFAWRSVNYISGYIAWKRSNKPNAEPLLNS